jgi:hypothetical protein
MFNAELDELFDDDLAVDAVVAGATRRIIPGPVATARSDYDGEIRTTWDFTAQEAHLPAPCCPIWSWKWTASGGPSTRSAGPLPGCLM